MTGLQAAGALAAFGLVPAMCAGVAGRDDTAWIILFLFSIPLVLRLILMALFN